MPKGQPSHARPRKKSLWTRPKGSPYESPGEEYIFSPEEISLDKLCKKWEVNLRTIKNWSVKQSWIDKRKQYHEMVSDAVFKKNVEGKTKRIDKLYENLKFLWTAQIEALKQNLIETKDGRARPKKMKASELSAISNTCARVSEWAFLLEGKNIKEIQEQEEEKQTRNITVRIVDSKEDI